MKNPGFGINTLDTCFLLNLSEEFVKKIKHQPFVLECREVLEIGDCFTQIGKSGSAGNQRIQLSTPWVQRYEGIIDIPPDDPWYPNQQMVLFSAFIPNETELFAFPKKNREGRAKGKKDGYYIAYLRHCETKLFHIRSSGSSCVAHCDSITRWPTD